MTGVPKVYSLTLDTCLDGESTSNIRISLQIRINKCSMKSELGISLSLHLKRLPLRVPDIFNLLIVPVLLVIYDCDSDFQKTKNSRL